MAFLEWFTTLFYTGIATLIIGFILAALIARRLSCPTPVITRTEDEKYFLD